MRILLICLLLTGCCISKINDAYLLKLEVDSYGNDEDAPLKKCYVHTKDLRDAEYSAYLNNVLISKGYTITDSFDKANVAVFFNYGISDPMEYTYSKIYPSWEKIESLSTVTGSVYVNPYSRKITYTEKIVENPVYGVKLRTAEQSTIFYLKYVEIEAYDLDYHFLTGKDKVLWQTYITSTGKINDIRAMFPAMVQGAKKYIANSSGTKKELSLYISSSGTKVVE